VPPFRPVAQSPEPEEALPTTAEAMKQEAFAVAGRVLEDFPNNSHVTGLMGTVYNRYFNTTKAVECWQECVQQDPRCAAAYRDLGTVAFEKGEYEKAADLWLKALQIDASRSGVHGRYGAALLKMGKPAEAVAAFEKEKTLSPDSSSNFFRLGQAYLQLKQYEKAIEGYEKAIEIRPDQSSAWYGLVTAHARLGQTDRAKQCEEQFKTLRAAEDAVAVEKRKTPGDKGWVAQLLAETHGDAARVYAARRNSRQAEYHWRRAAALDPKDRVSRQQLALLYMQSRRVPEAVDVSKQLTALDPGNAPYRHKLGTALAALRQFDAAEEAFRKGIELAPQEAIGYHLLARLLLTRNHKLAEAKTLAGKLVELESTARNYSILGEVCQRTGDLAGALAAARRASELEPANPQYRRTYRTLQERK